MIKKLKERFSGLVKDKKGVSELVQMIIIVGITIAAAAIVGGVIFQRIGEIASNPTQGIDTKTEAPKS